MNRWFVVHNLLAYSQHSDMIGNIVKKPGVRQPRFSRFAGIDVGDLVVYYARKDMVVVGIFEVVSDMEYVPNDPVWNEILVYRIKSVELPPAGYFFDFKDFVSDPAVHLDMFPDKKKWGGYLQGQICKLLTERDYFAIKDAMSQNRYLKSVKEIQVKPTEWYYRRGFINKLPEFYLKREWKRLRTFEEIPEHVLTKTQEYFAKGVQQKIVTERQYPELFYASLFLAFRMSGVTKEITDISKISDVNPTRLRKLSRLLRLRLELNVPRIDPKQLMVVRSEKLHIPENITRRAASLIDKAQKRLITQGRKPASIAAGAILKASNIEGYNIKLLNLAKIFGVSDASVRKFAQKLEDLKDF